MWSKIKNRVEVHALYGFLHLVRGNWRNALYIECGPCPYAMSCSSGYLLTTDLNGVPILFDVQRFEALTGETVDKQECVGIISKVMFDSLFDRWLLWNVDDPQSCAIRQLQNRIP